jgi:beta-glucosidase
VHRALTEGMPVEGYFFWTLVDNYEWNHGMDLDLGLYALDLETKARTLRPIGESYREIIRARGF